MNHLTRVMDKMNEDIWEATKNAFNKIKTVNKEQAKTVVEETLKVANKLRQKEKTAHQGKKRKRTISEKGPNKTDSSNGDKATKRPKLWLTEITN